MRVKNKGFTLLEILVALFIFTILAMILTSSLHNIINIQDRTEKHAERLRQLQFALLMFSRDVEQTVNRPIVNAQGKEEPAFLGTSHEFSFTRTGLSNPEGVMVRSNLQRTAYYWNKDSLQRVVWSVLDQAPNGKSTQRSLLTGIAKVQFRYLDKDKFFHEDWPLKQSPEQVLPRAVEIELTLLEGGSINQLYVIYAQTKKSS